VFSRSSIGFDKFVLLFVRMGKHNSKKCKETPVSPKFRSSCISNTRKFDHITLILRELKWMTVDQTLVYKDIVQTYKCMSDLSPPYLSEKFYLRDTIHNYSTRSKRSRNSKIKYKLWPKNFSLSRDQTLEQPA
jgi:hypothetical protein